MSYDPSHRKPPRQERWPQATPPDGWPSYRVDDAHLDGRPADSRYAADGQGAYPATAGYRRQAADYQDASGGPGDRGYQSAVATDTFPPARNGYGAAAGYGEISGYGDAWDGYGWTENGYGGNGHSGAGNGYGAAAGYGEVRGYGDARDGYDCTENGYGGNGYSGAGNANGNGYSGVGNGNSYGTGAFPSAGGINGYAGAADDFAEAPDGYAGAVNHLGPGSYTEPGVSDPRLMAPDAGVDPDRWRADQDLRREASRRGLAVGAVTGFLAAAVAIGVSTLAAGFVRPQASPMAALGSVFIDRTPAALKNVAVQHFGTHGRTVLLLGMYAAIAVLAVGIGLLARRAAAAGVAGLAAFSMVAAFVTITRPGGRVSDVAPAVIGGIAGVAALLWLMQASAPPQRVPPQRQARGHGRRRA